MSSSESTPGEPHLSYDQIEEAASTLLGVGRVDPLASFCTENYLQRKLEGFLQDPNSMLCSHSRIFGGNEILEFRRQIKQTELIESGNPDSAPRSCGLSTFFRVGFGMAEKTATSEYYVGQADGELVSPDVYKAWLTQPLAVRITDIAQYLKSCGADMLAVNFLEPEHEEGTFLRRARDIGIAVPRVNGQEPYEMQGNEPDVQTEVIEGAVAAFFLLREHQIAQELSDMQL